jgi:hypothetical protein
VAVFDEEITASRAPRSRRFVLSTDSATMVTPPDGHRVVVVKTPSSSLVRDIASLRRDLELANVYADEFAKVDPAELAPAGLAHNTQDLRLALWFAAIVAYGRAFNNGVRSERLDTTTLDEEQLEAHNYFLDLRNKHVAHAVNDYEQTVVLAYLTNSAFASRHVTRVGHIHIEVLAGDKSDAAMLVRLLEHFIRAIHRRLNVLHDEIIRELGAMGKDAVYALPDFEAREPQRAKVAKRRK